MKGLPIRYLEQPVKHLNMPYCATLEVVVIPGLFSPNFHLDRRFGDAPYGRLKTSISRAIELNDWQQTDGE